MLLCPCRPPRAAPPPFSTAQHSSRPACCAAWQPPCCPFAHPRPGCTLWPALFSYRSALHLTLTLAQPAPPQSRLPHSRQWPAPLPISCRSHSSDRPHPSKQATPSRHSTHLHTRNRCASHPPSGVCSLWEGREKSEESTQRDASADICAACGEGMGMSEGVRNGKAGAAGPST